MTSEGSQVSLDLPCTPCRQAPGVHWRVALEGLLAQAHSVCQRVHFHILALVRPVRMGSPLGPALKHEHVTLFNSLH